MAQQLPMSEKSEIGLWIGGAGFHGDIVPSLGNYHRTLRPAGGVYFRYNFDPRLAWKTSLNTGILYGHDEFADNPFHKARNLHFRNHIMELATQFEFNFFKFITNSNKNRFTPYLFIGASGFLHNPQAEYDDEWHDLQPLGTEGQQFPDYSGVKPYKLFQMAALVGGGFKFNIRKGFNLGLEVGYRSSYTDYLDDVSGTYVDAGVLASGQNGALAAALADRSAEIVGEPIGREGKQRGNSVNNDAFWFGGLQISYTIRSAKCPPIYNKPF